MMKRMVAMFSYVIGMSCMGAVLSAENWGAVYNKSNGKFAWEGPYNEAKGQNLYLPYWPSDMLVSIVIPVENVAAGEVIVPVLAFGTLTAKNVREVAVVSDSDISGLSPVAGRKWIRVGVTFPGTDWGSVMKFAVSFAGSSTWREIVIPVAMNALDSVAMYQRLFHGITVTPNSRTVLDWDPVFWHEPGNPHEINWCWETGDDSSRQSAEISIAVPSAGVLVLSGFDAYGTALAVKENPSIVKDESSFSSDVTRYGSSPYQGSSIRKITVSAATTVGLRASGGDYDIDLNCIRFYRADRKSVAIDADFSSPSPLPISREKSDDGCTVYRYLQGYVTGSGVYTEGEKAEFKAVAARGESFDHWEVVAGEFPPGIAGSTSETISFTVTAAMVGTPADENQMLLRAIWKSCDYPVDYDNPVQYGVDADIYGPFVPGESVSLSIPTLVGYTAKGLPSGLKLNKNTGEISGTPTKPTGDAGVTVTFTKKGAETLTAKFVVGPIPTVNVTLAGDAEKCKVSGANKAYLVGKKVSLVARAPKGTAFVGWFKDGEPWPSATESGKAKLSYVMTAESLELVAKFEKEKMSLACPGLAAGKFTVGVGGTGDGIPLEITTQSGVKSVKATKLPTGMKLVKDKTTGDWLITGAPSKAGSYNVVLTVTAVSGATESITVPVTIEALPSWAVGTFVGVARQVDYDGSGNVVRDGDGLHDWYDVEVTAIVAANGKISGKAVFPGSGGSMSFKASSYTGFSDGCYRVSGVDMSVKGHKIVLDLMVTERVVVDSASAGDMIVAAREVAPKTPEYLVTISTADTCPLRQNIWKAKNMPLPPSVNGKSVSIERDGYVYTLAFGKDGAVTDTLVQATDPKKVLKKGKPIFSVVDYVDGVWFCELFGSVILDTSEGGEARIRCCVRISGDGNLTCELVE